MKTKKHKTITNFISIVLLLIFTSLIALKAYAADSPAASENAKELSTQGLSEQKSSSVAEFQSFSELSGKRVSMLTGAPFEELVSSKVPGVGEFSYYTTMADMMLALRTNKTDAILMNNAISVLAVNRNTDLALFPENLQDGVFGIAFEKGNPQREEWQSAYDAIPKEEIQAAWEKWTGADESIKVMPQQDWPGTNGTVKVAACDTLEPMSYVGEGGELKGFDLEVILMMAKKLDVHVKFEGMEFSAILSYVQSGKALMGAGSIIVTQERREAVDFIEYYPAAFVLIVRGVQAENGENSDLSNLSFLEHGRVAVQMGTISGEVVRSVLPDIEEEYYNTQMDCMTALQTGKVDFWATDEPSAKYMIAGSDNLEIIGNVGNNKLGAIFSNDEKGRALCAEYSDFVDKLREEGTIDELKNIWFDGDESQKSMPDYENLPATNGVLRMAVEAALPPFVYVKDNRFVGYDIDIAARFCETNGYHLEVISMNFDGILPAVQSGKCDFAACGIAETKERAQSVLFSSPNYYSATSIIVRKENAGDVLSDESKKSGIAASFYKTFIREDRWKLFVSGVETTLIITVLSIILGTLLGFCIFLMCRGGNPVANYITKFCIWLVQGMPMVVLLMILYYVIFGNVSISGVAVAVIGFTLTFGAAVFGLLRMGVGAVDNGQYEAANALGYSDNQTFFKIILPQALPHVMPTYRGQIVDLLKATAIVGYIAVQDVTKIGDIVRSRTYEAFFPLIALTVIYFVLEGLLGFAVSRISLNFDPKRRTPAEILKGVKTHD